VSDVFALEQLDAAKQAIVNARTIPELKLLKDQFSVMADLAKRQGVELDIQQEIGACRIWTRDKLGKLYTAMPKNGGGRPAKTGNTMLPVSEPTLAELGISKMESSRLQSEAKIPTKTKQEYIEEAKEKGDEVTIAGMHRKAKANVSDKPTYDGDEWHTPIEYVNAAREVMGEIELDPATCETAQAEIEAKHYLTKQDDALSHPWFGRVWMNPPYSMPKIERFIDKLITEFDQGNVTEAIVLVNNSSDTKWFHRLLSRFPACFTKGRVQFWHPSHHSFATRQGQAFFYLGPDWKGEIFSDVFTQFGIVVENVQHKESSIV
jgi:phage N-6-adenine-methyltransferase